MILRRLFIGLSTILSSVSVISAGDINGTIYKSYLFDDFDFLGFVMSPFTALLGDYFYLMFGMLPVFMVFLKSQDIVLPVIIGLLFTAAFGYYLPETAGVAVLMLLCTGIGAILFKLFKGSGS